MLAATGYGLPVAIVIVLCLFEANIQESMFVNIGFVVVLTTSLVVTIISARLVSGQRRRSWISVVNYLDVAAPSGLKFVIKVTTIIVACSFWLTLVYPDNIWTVLSTSILSAVLISSASLLIGLWYSKNDYEEIKTDLKIIKEALTDKDPKNEKETIHKLDKLGEIVEELKKINDKFPGGS